MLEAELAAGGVDIMALFLANGMGNLILGEDAGEGLLTRDIGALPIESMDGIVGDEVNMGVQVAGDGGEVAGLIEGIVHILNEDKLEGGHTAGGGAKVLNSGEELFEGVFAVDRHDLLADLVGGSMEADGEPRLDRFAGELLDLGHEPGSGNRDAASAEVEAPIGIEDGEGASEGTVIGERFAHSHEDDIIEGDTVGGRGFGAFLLKVGDMEELRDNLGGGEIAFKAGEPGGAEFAAIGATHLGGDAESATGLGDPDALLRVADENGFDESVILALEEEFFGDVVGLFDEDDGIGKDLKMFGKLSAELGGEVGH